MANTVKVMTTYMQVVMNEVLVQLHENGSSTIQTLMHATRRPESTLRHALDFLKQFDRIVWSEGRSLLKHGGRKPYVYDLKDRSKAPELFNGRVYRDNTVKQAS